MTNPGENKTDKVYASPRTEVGAFSFNEQVADVFDNMISRSVPGYEFSLEMIGILTARYAQPDSRCFDLGCSLGAATLQIKQHAPEGCHIVAVDNSAAMIKRCEAVMARDNSPASVEVKLADLREIQITNASVVVMNFTLQFVEDTDRPELLKRIATGLNSGGIFILSEKIVDENPAHQELLTEMHHDFKRSKGYSDLEISQKRTALENVLVPNSDGEHLQRLKDAGFSSVMLYTRCLNFVSYLAVK